MIGIVNYGLGNINAILNIYKNLDIPAFIILSEEDFDKASHLILPGVGSFDWAMNKLNKSGLKNKLNHCVINKKIPVLGICVGMQMMAVKSEEGVSEGLGWVNCDIMHFRNHENWSKKKVNVPHMGWNNINIVNKDKLFYELDDKSYFYFLHSFFFRTNNNNQILTMTNYNGDFTSSFKEKNIYGVQFHPEKSHNNGIKLLYNFSSII